MKINFIQISNILRFKYFENIDEAPKIILNKDLNILIGQNGAGKSTFLEVVGFILNKILFLPTSHNKKNNTLGQKNDNNCSPFRLKPNWDTEPAKFDKQKIKIEIELDDIDNENIKILLSHRVILNKLATEHKIDQNQQIQNLAALNKKFTLEISLLQEGKLFDSKISPNNSDINSSYLKYYNLYKELIIIHNNENESYIPNLYETFTLISSYRDYHQFNPQLILSTSSEIRIDTEEKNRENCKSIHSEASGMPHVFHIIKNNTAKKHYDLYGETNSDNKPIIESNKLLKNINNKLKLINLRFEMELKNKLNWEYSFKFFDIKRNKYLNDFDDLSAGQKAIIHLIFEAYGKGEIKGGLIIIDEPEIHLHYQFQQEYLNIIEELNKEKKCQYILVTHSECFINSKTIHKINRFSLDADNHTLIHSPALSTEQHTLIKILDNTRTTHAFFAKKIILVEGDTDQCFFTAALKILAPQAVQEIVILPLLGKESYPAWKDFFERFGLSVYFIGDIDNLFTMKSSNKEKLTAIQKKFNSNKKARNQKNKTSLREILKPLLKDINIKLKDVNDMIHSEYTNKVYILQKGEIEDYTNTKHGKLREMISFCENVLPPKLKTSALREIRRIILEITK